MIIAQEKKQENIAEYIVYMWHVEELIRACGLDMEEIEIRVLPKYIQTEEVMQEIRQWYRDLIDMMRTEGVAEEGHIQIVKDATAKLEEQHLKLLNSPQETAYSALYYRALPSIVHLRTKSGKEELNEIETCLTAVYGYLMLKMQQAEISPATKDAIKQISNLLACLTASI
jgi:hypothetical protein